MDLKIALNAIKAIGVGTGARVSRYSLMRELVDWRWNRHKSETSLILPGGMLSSESLDNGAVILFECATLRVKYLAPNLVSLTWEPGALPLPYSIAREEWDPVNIDAVRERGGLTLSSDPLRLAIRDDGTIQFRTRDDAVLRTDRPPKKIGGSWRLTTQLRTDEHIYGMGERAAPFNLAGCQLRTWNTDPGGSYSSGKDPIYICTPVFMAVGSTGIYQIFFENSHPATFDFNPISTIEFLGGALRYYFAYGSPEELLKLYTELTGRPPMPPRWVFGYHQSRWGYRTEADIREVMSGFKANRLPISAIHLDIDYMDGYRVFTIDKSRFPTLRQLSVDMQEEGVKLVTIIDPAVKKDASYPVYKDGLHEDIFCKTPSNKTLHGVVWPGWAAYPDFTNPRTRAWWGGLYSNLLSEGIAGFWHDMNEPVSFSAWGDNTIPLETRHNLDGREGNHFEAHNLYGLLMNRAGYEGLQLLQPDKRHWLITRSGWAGLQRYAWNWTGDVASTWEALSQTVRIVLGLSLSGHYFSGSDIGGFSGNPSAELYLRWFQLSTFHPFFRTHSAIGTERREPWVFGEPYTSIIRQYLLLRYQLIPYFYTLAWQSHLKGIPIIRPMFWMHPEWSASWDIDDQFYLGDEILIAPVLLQNCESRSVELPPGDWYLFWDDTCYTGPSKIQISVSLDRIPIFIRAGCVLPLEKSGELELHIYPKKDSNASGILYSDAGDGYDQWRLDQFEYRQLNGDANIIRQVTGTYPFPYSKTACVVHGEKVQFVWMDGEEVEVRNA